MKYTIEKREVEHWTEKRWAICRDGITLAHYDRVESAMAGYMTLVRNGSFTPSLLHKPVELVFEGRSKVKLSILSQCRIMASQPMPEHDPQSIREALYPERAA